MYLHIFIYNLYFIFIFYVTQFLLYNHLFSLATIVFNTGITFCMYMSIFMSHYSVFGLFALVSLIQYIFHLFRVYKIFKMLSLLSKETKFCFPLSMTLESGMLYFLYVQLRKLRCEEVRELSHYHMPNKR